MTREQFKEARINALEKYMKQAVSDYNSSSSNQSRTNALSRWWLAFCYYQKCGVNLDGSKCDEKFWTPENERAYSMIYSKIDDVNSVSAM